MQLTARNLTYRIKDRLLLDRLELTVDRGDSVAIVGPSGVGKSTLLALLGGLLTPTEGRVRVHGGTAADDGPVNAYVSWVLQTVNVLADRSVLDNVALGGLSDGLLWDQATAQVGEALAAVHLDGVADRPVRTLSGGEVQRVVIARALVSTRPFVLADEPTGQLDADTTQRVMDALSAASPTRGVVVVTHDPQVARRCSRILRLDGGKLVRQ